MESSKTETGAEKQNVERPLPRGLDSVSHLFLSNGSAGRRTTFADPASNGAKDSPAAVLLSRGQPLPRAQLLALIKGAPAALEEGMKWMDSDIPCDVSGNIELLALDAANNFAIIELDDNPNDGLLLRGIGHFDWVSRNAPIVRQMHQGQVINLSLQPRLFLVAPDFTPSFRLALRHITSIQIHCLKYHCIALPGGTGVFFENV
jgi:hypothetical protein